MLTPEQLDAIAVKFNLLRRHEYDVPPCRREPAGCHVTTFFGVDNIPRGPLDPTSRHDAMLVLEAMGQWCEKNSRPTAVQQAQLTSSGREWVCEIVETSRFEGDIIDISELGNTIPEAVFKCAAKLVVGMM